MALHFDELRNCVGIKRTAASNHFVGDYPEGINITGCRYPPTSELFGGHVIKRPKSSRLSSAQSNERLVNLCEPKINDCDLFVACTRSLHHDVLGLEISVQ